MARRYPSGLLPGVPPGLIPGLVSGLVSGLVWALGGVWALATPLAAQTPPEGGPRLTFSFATSARVDDNFNLSTPAPGTSAFVSHSLGLDYETRTRSQRLAFGVSGLLRYGEIRGGTGADGFDEPRIYLDYEREAANARFALNAEHQETEVSFLRLADTASETFDLSDLVSDRGSRGLSSARARLELGRRGPLNLVLALSHVRRDYSGVTDPELFDTRTSRGDLTARLKFSPVLTGRLEASLNRYDADDAVQTDREDRRFGFGLEADLSRVLRLDVSLGHDRIETRSTTGTTVDSGLSGRIALLRSLPDGAMSIRFDNSFSTNGNRSTLTFGRVLEMRRAQLSVDLGLARQEGISRTYLVGDITYMLRASQEDTLQLSLSRDVRTSSVENVVELTRAALGYRRQLTELSGLGLSLNYIDSRNIAGTALSTDRTRGALQLTYDHALARDWTLTGGVAHRYLDTQGTGTARSNAIFLNLSKSFDILP